MEETPEATKKKKVEYRRVLWKTDSGGYFENVEKNKIQDILQYSYRKQTW